MTYEKQDILESFYSGNTKRIGVTIYDDDGNLKDISNTELTYVMMDRTDYDNVKLVKSSYVGDSEIKVVGLGLCEIYIKPIDTLNLYGKFRHHLNGVDENGYVATLFTGLVEIHKTSAQRYRKISKPAYLNGTI